MDAPLGFVRVSEVVGSSEPFPSETEFFGRLGGIFDHGDLVQGGFLGKGIIGMPGLVHVRVENPGIVFGFCEVDVFLQWMWIYH